MGNPIESWDMRHLRQLFSRFTEVRRSVLLLLVRIFPSDKKHSTRNCIKFADVEYLVLKVNSREDKKYLFFWLQQSKKSTRNRSNFVKSHWNFRQAMRHGTANYCPRSSRRARAQRVGGAAAAAHRLEGLLQSLGGWETGQSTNKKEE